MQQTVEILQVPFLDWLLACPLLCNARCAVHGRQGRRHLCRGADAVSHGAVQRTIVVLQLQFIDKVFDVSVVQVQQIPRVPSVRRQSRSHSCNRRIRAWTRSLKCPLCNDKCPWFSVQKTAKVPQLQYIRTCGRCPCWRSSSTKSSPFGGCGGGMVFLSVFPHFSHSSRLSGVERQFSEPSIDMFCLSYTQVRTTTTTTTTTTTIRPSGMELLVCGAGSRPSYHLGVVRRNCQRG